MALTPTPADAPADYHTWTREALEAEDARLAALRTDVRLQQNAVAAALVAARIIDPLTPEQRAAYAARAGRE